MLLYCYKYPHCDPVMSFYRHKYPQCDDVAASADPKPFKHDEDGLPIYTAKSLGIGRGGDTPDCPFDCWCCF